MTTRLEDLKPEALVQGLVGREAVRVVTAEMLEQDGAWANSFFAAMKLNWNWWVAAASGASREAAISSGSSAKQPGLSWLTCSTPMWR